MNYTDGQLEQKSLKLRRSVVKWIKHAGAGHTGGSLSCIDILNVLYNRILNVSPENFTSPDRDRYVQSKGHAVEALFVVLADAGFFDESDLETLCCYQSHYVGHPTRKVNGVEQNTGGLGHGLPICVGTALAGKMDAKDYRVYTLLGDGELAEGSNWEAAMSAAHYKLDNLTAVIDCNTLQIAGRTADVMNSEPLVEKWEAFGWAVRRIDGHDIAALTEALRDPLEAGKPSMVIADTVKGRGVSFMEDVGKWHHGVPNDEEFAKAMEGFDMQLAAKEGALS
ncbi:transketolase [Pelagicoccus sp. SDUM812005]|uniref:transketolase n=1 Tax=Pelagicoccus sp. SDUM812005 TaxID=3041257 RepID=UPI0028103B30|nr:transketolase [Pelagicoccus sp. SDUM812005]MDQ8179348.1 transketolase [Pelagicoccus sp. SDUM812005]